ncbi:MAG TPA: hypothetical protein EYH40_02995 [Desulfurococcales archaeon]|nr:hypothetical protein [Desulfurococcales archaeon]
MSSEYYWKLHKLNTILAIVFSIFYTLSRSRLTPAEILLLTIILLTPILFTIIVRVFRVEK